MMIGFEPLTEGLVMLTIAQVVNSVNECCVTGVLMDAILKEVALKLSSTLLAPGVMS